LDCKSRFTIQRSYLICSTEKSKIIKNDILLISYLNISSVDNQLCSWKPFPEAPQARPEDPLTPAPGITVRVKEPDLKLAIVTRTTGFPSLVESEPDLDGQAYAEHQDQA